MFSVESCKLCEKPQRLGGLFKGKETKRKVNRALTFVQQYVTCNGEFYFRSGTTLLLSDEVVSETLP